MLLTLVTVALDPDTGTFPAQPLAELDGEVVSVVEHFFHHAGLPHLLLVVHHRGAPAEPRTQRTRKASVRSELTPDEQGLFDRLRAWRNGRAQADGVPPYVLLTNRQLAAVARRRPTTTAALREIDGIGDGKVGRFGRDLLDVLASEGQAGGPDAT